MTFGASTQMKNTTVETKIVIYLLLFSCLIISCNNSKKLQRNITLQTFEVEKGWGFAIKINDKEFINQQRIPGIQGNYPFKSKEDAEKIGELMIKKLKERKMPSISLEELKEAKIELPE